MTLPSQGAAIPLEPDAETLAELTAACASFVREHIATLGEQPSFDLDGYEPLRDAMREPVPEGGAALADLLEKLGPAVAKSFNTAGPGYLAFIPGGGLPVAALGEYLALSTNRFVGVSRAAPVLAQIESTTIAWLAELLGYPRGAAGILTSGGSLSNLTAIVSARAARLGEDFARGMIYASTETHASVAKAARIAGFPSRNVRLLPVDARLRLDVASLARAVAEDRARGQVPFLVVANIGTTNTGAVDPVPAILEVAAEHHLWVHADAAYGGFFRLVKGGEALMPGLERCDSITLDPHKGLFLPYGTGCLLVRDPKVLELAHATDAVYLRDVAPAPGEVNFTDVSPELSREFRGLRLWLPLKVHGVAAFRAALADKLALARLAYERLRASSRFEILDEPQLSIVAFRLRERPGESVEQANARNALLLSRTNARGRVFMSSTRLDGRLTLRICVLSFRTHEDRVIDAVSALEEEAAALDAKGAG
jgi:aromatic-L-amino-acid decarboxylase